MLSSKFSLVLVCLVSFNCYSMYSEKECLDSAFSASVSHKNKKTFGMAKTKLEVKKDKCEITVSHEKLKFVKNKWKIDVCREPVHIKSGVKGVEVLKKRGQCPNQHSADVCDALNTIKEVVQDDGLIFAPGENENQTTDHGRLYCAYQLLGGYLDGGRIYSRYAVSRPAPSFTKPLDLVPVSKPTPEPSEGGPAVDPVPPADQSTQGQTGSF